MSTNGAGRRPLPRGWRVIEGGAGELAPELEQSRDLARFLFRGSLTLGGVGFEPDPARAREAWSNFALRQGDVTLCRLIDQLDVDSFDEAWRGLARRLYVCGAEDTIDWLKRRARAIR